MSRCAMVVALCCLAVQPAEARPKAKPVKRVAMVETPAVTFVKLPADQRAWRLAPLTAPQPATAPVEWRFTGSKVKMRLAF